MKNRDKLRKRGFWKTLLVVLFRTGEKCPSCHRRGGVLTHSHYEDPDVKSYNGEAPVMKIITVKSCRHCNNVLSTNKPE